MNNDIRGEITLKQFAGPGGYDNPALTDNERAHSRLRKSSESVLQNPRGPAGLKSRAASQLSMTSRQSKPVKLGGISYR